MINSKTWLKAGLFLFLLSSFLFAAKEIYIPKSFKNFDSPSSQWSSTRMDSTENWIILWEAGFGSDPSLAPAPYKVNMKELKAVVENSFDINLNTMKMVTKGSSNTDKYKIMKQRNWSCDTTPLQHDLDFRPGYRLKEGVEATVKWYRERGWL